MYFPLALPPTVVCSYLLKSVYIDFAQSALSGTVHIVVCLCGEIREKEKKRKIILTEIFMWSRMT